mmetsp:Transcript_41680/g.134761  ORF Transcript_41680/g.134761 Transcript_41680/m.134761 type:complete len:241 (-) Transcript_41680:338-1060(-)
MYASRAAYLSTLRKGPAKPLVLNFLAAKSSVALSMLLFTRSPRPSAGAFAMAFVPPIATPLASPPDRPPKRRMASGVLSSAAMIEPQFVCQVLCVPFCNPTSARVGRTSWMSAGRAPHSATASVEGNVSVCFRSVGPRRRKLMASESKFLDSTSALSTRSAHERSCPRTSRNCHCKCPYTSVIVWTKLLVFRAGKMSPWFSKSRHNLSTRRTSSSSRWSFAACCRNQRFRSSMRRVRGSF